MALDPNIWTPEKTRILDWNLIINTIIFSLQWLLIITLIIALDRFFRGSYSRGFNNRSGTSKGC